MGASMAGLLAARVLADHSGRVTLVERDRIGEAPESRKGQPQTSHLHGLFAHGTKVLAEYFPGILDDLVAAGAMVGDSAERMRWFVNGAYRARFHSDLIGVTRLGYEPLAPGVRLRPAAGNQSSRPGGRDRELQSGLRSGLDVRRVANARAGRA
jgi:2-polyprenyl-6-methoxyphenol hydroxylase-like FAD-dependent oxidoreductase